MIEMETMDLYESSEELSLFGRDQLLKGLGSPLEPDLYSMFPDQGEITTATEMLVKVSPSLLKQELVTSNMIQSLPFTTEEQASSLDMSWLDTKLDLFDLVDTSNGDCGEFNSIFMNPPEVCANNTPAVSPTVPHVPVMTAETSPVVELSAEDLFNQITMGLTQTEASHVSTSPDLAADNARNLLSDVFSRLSSDIELIVQENSRNLPDFGQSILSPVSVDDIESLLSGPVSPASTVAPSPADSGLDSTVSSRPESPDNVSFHANNSDSDGDYAPVKPTRSRKRTTPYSKSSPADKKDRKKQQNKTAASKYRLKKKEETGSLDDQYTQLETKNKSLRDKVESMTREIQYLKDLMAEVIKVKKGKTDS